PALVAREVTVEDGPGREVAVLLTDRAKHGDSDGLEEREAVDRHPAPNADGESDVAAIGMARQHDRASDLREHFLDLVRDPCRVRHDVGGSRVTSSVPRE